MTGARSALAKTERNEEIIRRIVEGRGDVSLQSVADDYGITRARVQRLVGLRGISIRDMKRAQKKHPERITCTKCGVPYAKGHYTEHCKAMGHRRLTPSGEKVARNATIVRLISVEKYNTTEVAEYFGIPQPVVTRILHRAGIRLEGRRKRKGGLPARGGLVNDAKELAVVG